MLGIKAQKVNIPQVPILVTMGMAMTMTRMTMMMTIGMTMGMLMMMMTMTMMMTDWVGWVDGTGSRSDPLHAPTLVHHQIIMSSFDYHQHNDDPEKHNDDNHD